MRKEGRKIESYSPSEGYESINIRFNSSSSEFLAEFMEKTYREKDINKLKEIITKEADSRKNVIWQPVIVINLDSFDWNKTVSGFDVETRLLGTITYPDKTIKKIIAHWSNDMHKDDDSDSSTWKPIYPQEELTQNDKNKIIEYTPEKYITLKFMIDKMEEVRQKIKEILQGDKCESFIGFVNQNRQKFFPLPKEVVDTSTKEDKR